MNGWEVLMSVVGTMVGLYLAYRPQWTWPRLRVSADTTGIRVEIPPHMKPRRGRDSSGRWTRSADVEGLRVEVNRLADRVRQQERMRHSVELDDRFQRHLKGER